MSLDLFCVPHAGGSARTFLRWQREFPQAIRVRPLEIAGRGRRTKEPRQATVREVAADLATRVDPPGRYAILGHSMGGLIAYELARTLIAEARPAPEFLVVAATRPPHLLSPIDQEQLAELPDDDLLDALAASGTIPETLRRSPMRGLFVPIVRGDLRLIAAYRPPTDPAPLPIDLLAWHGADDPMSPGEAMSEWSRYTTARCLPAKFAGGHFFPHDDIPAVLEKLPR